jgi:PAS domain S-box-containing protein
MGSTPKNVSLHNVAPFPMKSIDIGSTSAADHGRSEKLPSRVARQSPDGMVDIGALLQAICTALVATPTCAARMELTHTADDALFIRADCVGPIVLIVSEAVTNAVKYAHPSGVPGKIKVACTRDQAAATLIEISDDGVGLPEGFDPGIDGNFGFQQMRGLSRKLGASLTFKSESLGLSVLLRVPPNACGIVSATASHAAGDGRSTGEEILSVLIDAQQSELLQALPAAIYTTDAAGRITFYNEAAAALWGCHPELGKSEFCGSWKLYWADGTPLPHDECPMALSLKERRPIRGMTAVAERPDGTRVTFVPYPTPLFDAAGTLIGGVNMLVDVTETNRADWNQHWLASIVESSDDAIVSKDLNGILMSWNAGAERIFGYTADEAIGKPAAMLIPADREDEESRILSNIRSGQKIDHYETVRQRKDGSLIDISLTVSPIKNSQGKVVGASKIARDVTERRRALEQQKLIQNEIKHRIRNTLATVQAIAMQTWRSASADERAAFTARLRALAEAHDLLTSESWDRAPLDEVVSRTLGPFSEKHGGRFQIDGPKVQLSAANSLLLTMALHELATNAAKYGALSNGSGRVHITWTAPMDNGRLKLVWQESGGPPVKSPEREGFGSTLISRAFEHEEGGAQIQFDPQGVICTMRFAL